MNQIVVSGMTPADVRNQINSIQELMSDCMKDGEHYGVIPGMGQKPTLLKAGAEKLAFMFRLATEYRIERIDSDHGHREYIVTCQLSHIDSGHPVGQGVGSASTMESKYRYRWINTDIRPEKQEAELLKAQGKGRWKKQGDNWIWAIKEDNPDIADVYNTVLKMGKKRAMVDAILSATAASDIFTQDIEEMKGE
jgi:hypothetical protein